MQLLHILALGAIIGAVCCDRECFNRKYEECMKNVLEEKQKYEFCSVQPKLTQCLTHAAKDCGTSFVSRAEKVQAVVEYMCNEGSDLNKEMKKHLDCLVEKVLARKECLPDVGDFKKPITPEDYERFQKEMCRPAHLDKVARCFSNAAKKSCGNDAEKFLQTFYGPFLELQKGICEEIILPEKSIQTLLLGPLSMI